MIKRVKLLSLAIALVLVCASQAGAQQDVVPAYRTTFYSDATHQTVVGYLHPDCRVFPFIYVQYYLEGTITYYTEDQFVGSCGPNGWEPIS